MFALVESAWHLLVGEALRKLFMNTRLKSGDVGPNAPQVATTHPLHFSAYLFDCLLAVAKLDFCALEATGKQVLCRL